MGKKILRPFPVTDKQFYFCVDPMAMSVLWLAYLRFSYNIAEKLYEDSY
jgi:hypothetical protein